MKGSGAGLPSFAHPPLHEVALGVQWEANREFSAAHLGLVWERFRKRFPKTRMQPEMRPAIERVGGAPLQQGLHISQEPTVPRVWFLDAKENELIQLQADRFVRNWRKIENDDVYPRYEDYIRPNFVADYRCFIEYLDSEGITIPAPNQCEVTYVNFIPTVADEGPHVGIAEIFDNIVRIPDVTGAEPESAVIEFTHTISDNNGEFAGRLRTSCRPSYRASDNISGYELKLMARGRPLGSNFEGALQFMDKGREIIVKAFANMTNARMHQLWGREDV